MIHLLLANTALPSDGLPLQVVGSIYILIIVFGMFGSACYSGLETTVYSMSRLRLMLKMSQCDQRAIRIQHELDRPDRLLSTLLIGTNASTFIASFGFTVFLANVLGLGEWFIIVLEAIVLTFALFIFSETVPKELARGHADSMAYRFVPMLRWTRIVLTCIGLLPLVTVVGGALSRLVGSRGHTPESTPRRIMAGLVHEGVGHGTISSGQTAMIEQALTMHRVSVRDEMVPWNQVSTLSDSSSFSELKEKAKRTKFTRSPVVDDTGRVVGLLDFAEFLYDIEQPADEESSTAFNVDPALFVEPDMNTRQALRLLQRRGERLAIVGCPDEPLGIITRRDLVEVLLGQFD